MNSYSDVIVCVFVLHFIALRKWDGNLAFIFHFVCALISHHHMCCAVPCDVRVSYRFLFPLHLLLILLGFLCVISIALPLYRIWHGKFVSYRTEIWNPKYRNTRRHTTTTPTTDGREKENEREEKKRNSRFSHKFTAHFAHGTVILWYDSRSNSERAVEQELEIGMCAVLMFWPANEFCETKRQREMMCDVLMLLITFATSHYKIHSER